MTAIRRVPDPDATLAEIRELADWIRNVGHGVNTVGAVRLAQLVDDMDRHLATGGRPPDGWRDTSAADGFDRGYAEAKALHDVWCDR